MVEKRDRLNSRLGWPLTVGKANEMERDKRQQDSDKLTAQAEKLVDLVDYQEDSVVSRTIIDKKTGTVTIFAFAEGQGLSEHTAPFDALVYIVDGKAEVTISGKKLYLQAGEMVIMPANEPHALKAIKEFKMVLVMIKT